MCLIRDSFQMNSSRLQITGWAPVWWKRELRYYTAARAGDAAAIFVAVEQEKALTYFLSMSSELESLFSRDFFFNFFTNQLDTIYPRHQYGEFLSINVAPQSLCPSISSFMFLSARLKEVCKLAQLQSRSRAASEIKELNLRRQRKIRASEQQRVLSALPFIFSPSDTIT